MKLSCHRVDADKACSQNNVENLVSGEETHALLLIVYMYSVYTVHVLSCTVVNGVFLIMYV